MFKNLFKKNSFPGFDTVGTVLSFAAYELACNPDVQDKLRQSLVTINNSYENAQSYDHILKNDYLDKFVCEVLRKFPPAPMIERLCVKDFTLEMDGKQIFMEKDSYFVVPVYGIHHDPNYFLNPDKFDPERFDEENKKFYQAKNCFIPFGIGEFCR